MQKLLVICGPTGTGKTNLALLLAKKFNGEIVSADSRQVYKGMDIATGKQPAELKIPNSRCKIEKGNEKWIVDGIPIHLYDVIEPDEKFSLAEYQQLALEKIFEIHARNKLPILVGGTGLYIQAVTEGLKIPKAAPDQKLREKLENRSLESLLIELEKVDPVTFQKIDRHNKRRIVRALEVYYQTGYSFSSLQKKYKVRFDILKIGLIAERKSLYEKVDKRIESWFENGFVDEVKILLKKFSPELPAMTSLGYRQAAMYLNKKLTLQEVKQRMKFETHGYIRRQMTWFRRDSSIHWFDVELPNLLHEIEELINEWGQK
jgi:tRNA dimethylallyltransferase